MKESKLFPEFEKFLKEPQFVKCEKKGTPKKGYINLKVWQKTSRKTNCSFEFSD